MLKRFFNKLRHLITELVRPKITANIVVNESKNLLKGKRIIVTGGTKGIGLSLAKKFIAEGANVLITGRDSEITKKVADSIGSKYLSLDLSDVSSITNFVKEAISILGGIDCLVNNAGISLHENTFFDVTKETFDAQFKTNLEGPFFLTQAISRVMIASKTSGSILFISSETAVTPDIRPYGLTKASLNSFSQGLAYLFIKNNIRVNTLCPGVVATALTGYSPENNLSYDFNSIGRLYLPEEISEIAAFVLSDISFPLSGQVIVCNNARTINARWR